MSERSVSEVVADLRAHACHYVAPSAITEAAALLERLDADARVAHDLLPTCPTCGGDETGADWSVGLPPCPDCSDGHVPLARLVALWEAVWDMEVHDLPATSGGLLIGLRSVKP